MTLGSALTAEEAEAFDAQIVPRYLTFFGALAVDMVLPCPSARIAHLGCRTGYLDALVAERLPGCSIAGIDPSPASLELARSRIALTSGIRASYGEAQHLPVPLPDGSFTHALSVHPPAAPSDRAALIAELSRLLVRGGQAIVATPLRGSFVEIVDLLREFAIREDRSAFFAAVDAMAAARPTLETLATELEQGGLVEVDVDVQLVAISFASGSDFLADPLFRILVMPEVAALIGGPPEPLAEATEYLHEAIAKYWAEGVFELTVNVGCASGRKP